MNKLTAVTILLLLLTILVLLFAVYKAYFYRKNYISAWSASNEWVWEFNMNSFPKSHFENKAHIILLGASITKNWDLSKYFKDVALVNMGIDGQFSGQYLLRFHRDVIDRKPKAVVIKLCAINITRNIPFEVSRNNVKMMTQLAEANGIQPILASIIPVTQEFDKTRSAKNITSEIQQFNQWLKNYAGEKGLLFLDYATALADEKGYLKDKLTADGLHPNELGYKIMAEVLQQKVLSKQW